MTEVRLLTLDELLVVAEVALGEKPAVRDLGLLEAAVHRPAATAYGREMYTDLHFKTAALLESLVRNHALVDGNKRLGWVAARTTYALNGRNITGGSIDEREELIVAIAEGKFMVDDIARTLYLWSEPGYPNTRQ